MAFVIVILFLMSVSMKIVVIVCPLCMFKGVSVYDVRLPRNSVSAQFG